MRRYGPDGCSLKFHFKGDEDDGYHRIAGVPALFMVENARRGNEDDVDQAGEKRRSGVCGGALPSKKLDKNKKGGVFSAF